MKKEKPKPGKNITRRERDVLVYLWLLKHTCERTSATTSMQEWSADTLG